MRKLLLFTMLMGLSSCSKPQPASPRPADACRIPRLETPDLVWSRCGGQVCLTPEDSILLARFLRRAVLQGDALAGCSLVKLVDE